jgi:hypothetical protein
MPAEYVSINRASDKNAPGLFAFAARFQAPSSFSFFKSSREESLHRFMFNCVGNGWYLGGVEGFGAGYEETAARLAELVASVAGNRTLFIGSSMGGYGAALYGAACNARRVIAFGAEIVTNLPCGYSRENLFRLTPGSPFYRIDPAVGASQGLYDFFVGEFCPVDIFGAAAANLHANVRMHVLADARHMAVYAVRDAGLLRSVVDAGLEGRKIRLPPSLYAEAETVEFLEGYAYRFDAKGYLDFLRDYARFLALRAPFRNPVKTYGEVFSFLYKARRMDDAHAVLDLYETSCGPSDDSRYKRLQLLYREKKYEAVMAFPHADHTGSARYFKAASAKRMGDEKAAGRHFAAALEIAGRTEDDGLKTALAALKENLGIREEAR